jgi:hypothetical protein
LEDKERLNHLSVVDRAFPVRSERVGAKVGHVTVLNLGRHFAVARKRWPTRCLRIGRLKARSHRIGQHYELSRSPTPAES